ncbi:MAG: hypothetical protein R2860_07495 [Desulfobacterales bacterium]
MADAVQNYLGPVGYWLIMVAAILAMLSAFAQICWRLRASP